ncbi:hypothetical protein AVEN_275056-1, partial [Araneus ventricosus]
MFASFLIIVLLAAGSFGPTQALDYLDMAGDDSSVGDLDEESQLAWKCTWLVFCDMHRIMEAKTIVDAVDNRTVMFIADKVRALFPEIHVTNDQIFDTEFWEKRADEIACSFSDEDREKLRQIPIDEYASEVCDESREDREECDKLAAGT